LQLDRYTDGLRDGLHTTALPTLFKVFFVTMMYVLKENDKRCHQKLKHCENSTRFLTKMQKKAGEAGQIYHSLDKNIAGPG